MTFGNGLNVKMPATKVVRFPHGPVLPSRAMFHRSTIAVVGTALYVLAVACAAVYPSFDHRTFSGLAAVMLGMPWIDHGVGLPMAFVLNAVIIYIVLAILSSLLSRVLRRP